MNLHFNKYGEGKPLLILHGLFGMGDNWATMSRAYAEKGFSVYAIDLRNHGRSPHETTFSFDVMAEDIQQFIVDHELNKVSIIGHSMGGKVAMFFAAKYPDLIEKLIVVDIGIKYYPPHHHRVLAAIHALKPEYMDNRKDAEERLRQSLNEESIIQFLLKNLYWNEQEKLAWRFNVKAIESNIEEVGKALPEEFKIDIPALFVSGERSGYILEEDKAGIMRQFSDVNFVRIPAAGHWVHAENPEVFFQKSLEFLG